jgi:DNA (cytosine-5)-methyltransferase 1
MAFTALELCAGGGGQALGLELAGFGHSAVVEYEAAFCETLRHNRPKWRVICQDIREFDGKPFQGVDLVAAGVPCPPFSIAGKQLGHDDERDMFPAALRIISEAKPRAVLIENVPGLGSAKFADYRMSLFRQLEALGYVPAARVLQAADFGVPQLRPRFLIVAMKPEDAIHFEWPKPQGSPPTVGETLNDLMASNGWEGADDWAKKANRIAPTLVGGSKKHGGPDLGPTRAKAQWLTLGVDGMGLGNDAPSADFPLQGNPKITVRMAARIQSFPDSWIFPGKKTVSYRQIGNAFPPLVAKAVGQCIIRAFKRQQADQKAGHAEPVQLRFLEDNSTPPPSHARKKAVKNVLKKSPVGISSGEHGKSH